VTCGRLLLIIRIIIHSLPFQGRVPSLLIPLSFPFIHNRHTAPNALVCSRRCHSNSVGRIRSPRLSVLSAGIFISLVLRLTRSRAWRLLRLQRSMTCDRTTPHMESTSIRCLDHHHRLPCSYPLCFPSHCHDNLHLSLSGHSRIFNSRRRCVIKTFCITILCECVSMVVWLRFILGVLSTLFTRTSSINRLVRRHFSLC